METFSYKRFYCPHCGHDQLNKKGFTPDGRQRYKCLECNRSSTYSKRKMGEKLFDPKNLLPIMLKNPLTLNKEELYSMGLLISDGSLSKTNQMSITLDPIDGYVLNYIKKGLVIPNDLVKAKCGIKDKYYTRLTWGYKHSEKYWKELGLIHNKTGNEVWLPYMASFHYLRGFLDGDGHVSGKRIGFTCANINYLHELQKFIFKYINNLGSLYFSKGAYNLQYYGTFSIQLGDLLYKDSEGLRLERKYNKYLEIKNSIK